MGTTSQAELHNKLVADIVKSIVKPPTEAGGHFSDVLVLLESVVTGVLLVLGKMEGWSVDDRETYLRAVVAAVRQRMER